MDALVAVRRRIAEVLLGGTASVASIDGSDASAATVLGDITLRPHQVDAVQRLQCALDRYGGALLADEPGMGKTYVALAIARRHAAAIVLAPASLKGQWMRSAERAGVCISWCSLETLSRRPFAAEGTLLIIDEAHHLRSPSAARYARAAALAVGKQVLLLSATPVHNRSADRAALLALFLGASAHSASDVAASEMIVRRTAPAELLPHRQRVRCLAVSPRTRPASPAAAPSGSPAEQALASTLRTLPAPLPAADGRAAAALVRMSLAHAWSSGIAALDASLRRALQQGLALRDSIEAGRLPTRRELRTWALDDESTQLAFPLIAAAPLRGDLRAARGTLDRHAAAVRALREIIAPLRAADAEARSALLHRILDAHPRETVLAFSCYAATVRALWQACRQTPGVVALTSTGVRAAGAAVQRDDVLKALSHDHARHDARMPLRLVLCTDLLSEGLDLRAASVVVHLDQPWTAARLEQREGRARRMGVQHRTISVYALRPPAGAARLLALGARLRTKRDAMRSSVAPGDAREELRRIAAQWLAAPQFQARADAHAAERPQARLHSTAAVRSHHAGALAVVHDSTGATRVVASFGDIVSDAPAELLRLMRQTDGAAPCAVLSGDATHARRRIRHWLRTEAGASASGAERHRDSGDARTRALRRFDRALAELPVHRRAALAARLVRARQVVATIRSAGAEQLLRQALDAETVDALLSAVERLPLEATNAACGPNPRPARIIALLLLCSSDAPATSARRSSHSAAWSGTAATR